MSRKEQRGKPKSRQNKVRRPQGKKKHMLGRGLFKIIFSLRVIYEFIKFDWKDLWEAIKKGFEEINSSLL